MTNPSEAQSAAIYPFSILFVITSLGRGGAERQMILLAEGLKERGHRLAIALLDAEGDLASEAEAKGVELIRLFTINRCGPIPKFARFRRAVRAFSPDVVHTYLPRDNARVAVIKRLIAPARLVWGIRASDMDWDHYGRTQKALWPLVTRLSRRADLIISNSWTGAQHHSNLGYPADRITVIPNGIDTETFRPNRIEGNSFRFQHNIKPKTKVIGMLARFDPMKGQHQIPAILSQIRSVYPDTLAVLVGHHDSVQRQKLRNIARDFGLENSIIILEPTGSPWAAINSFDVLAVPSIFGEGFPNVVAEAMACNVAVVAFDVGDVSLVLADPSAVATRDSISDFAQKILIALGKIRKRETRSRILKEFSLGSLCVTTEHSISAMLERATPKRDK